METNHISTAERLKHYDEARRAEATAAGKLIQRSSEFLVPAMEDAIILRTIDGEAVVSHEGRAANALSIEEVLNGELQMLVVDSTAIPLLVAQLKAGTDDDKDAAYQVGLLQSLAVSRTLAYLPDLLAQRFWLPTGLDTESLTDWAAAFGLRSPNIDIMAKRLAALALEPYVAPDPEPEDGKPVPRSQKTKKSNAIYLANREREVLRASAFMATASTCRAYKSMQTHGEILKGTIAGDVMLRERNILTGAVSRLIVEIAEDNTIRAVASTPFRLKEGRNARLFGEGEKSADVGIERLDYQGDDMTVTIQTSSANAKRWAREALVDGTDMWLSETVFYGAGGLEEGRWLNKSTEHAAASRTVPLDIILAAGA